MILVDTSVWIDHLKRADPDLVGALEANTVATHPMVIAELALGSIAGRASFLASMRRLARVVRASDDELLSFIENRRLFARGLGVVDAHLLASAALTPGAELWTRDKRLATAAAELGVGWSPA